MLKPVMGLNKVLEMTLASLSDEKYCAVMECIPREKWTDLC